MLEIHTYPRAGWAFPTRRNREEILEGHTSAGLYRGLGVEGLGGLCLGHSFCARRPLTGVPYLLND